MQEVLDGEEWIGAVLRGGDKGVGEEGVRQEQQEEGAGAVEDGLGLEGFGAGGASEGDDDDTELGGAVEAEAGKSDGVEEEVEVGGKTQPHLEEEPEIEQERGDDEEFAGPAMPFGGEAAGLVESARADEDGGD